MRNGYSATMELVDRAEENPAIADGVNVLSGDG